MSDKTLILMVGLPRSGKSTWARDQGHPIVNPDSIRLALHGKAYIQNAEHYVWAIAHTMVDALFLAGHDTVILDACNNSRKRRDEWKSDRWTSEFAIVREKTAVCLERASDDEILTGVINRMVKYHEPVMEDEGKSYQAMVRQEGLEPSPN